MPNFAGLISIDPKRSIGPITAMVTLEELSTDNLQITEHPVELGANINDHAFKQPAEVVIRCGWSNSSLGSLISGLRQAVSTIFGDSAFGSDYVSGVYNQLLALQESRIPFDVSTGKRTYQNMLMRSLALTTDPRTEYALMCTVVCRQVIIVQTQATTLPPRDAQANPQGTGEVANMGTKQTAQAFPAPGGWLPPDGSGGNG
ncbi:phage baseplate protein [Pseudomonas nitroreducens]|uniref:phage baseplate protein n=1 Tax=Pseudomonas nitroreducens TaxID=46680 RepID=UPI003CC821CC